MRDRLVLVKVLRKAGFPLLATLIGAQLVAALVPAATAVLLAGLVSRLTGPDHRVAGVLIAFALMLLLGYLAEAALTPLELAVQTRIDGTHRSRLMAMVVGCDDLGKLEQPQVRRLIAEVSADPKNLSEYSPGDGAVGQLRWAIGLLGLTAAGAILLTYRWWAVVLLLGVTVVIRRIQVRQINEITSELRRAYAEEMFADVWRSASVSPSAAKDIRTFGLAEWLVATMQRRIAAGNEPFWDATGRLLRFGPLFFVLIVAGLLPAYVGVTLDGGGVAVQTAVFTASWVLLQAPARPAETYRIVGAARVMRSFEELTALLGPPRPAGVVPPDQPGPPPLVRFEGVTFRYPGADDPVLTGLDLEIRPGELLAVVGLNGAGKSTLIKLLAGLYEPESGRITADGRTLAETGRAAWHRRISTVFQDFVRYPLSAADNISLSHQDSALTAAVAEAGFDAVLDRLPEGLETPLVRSRAGGVDLSGGQWQQVVLARALYALHRGASVLVLDEPTAHLDVRTEFELFRRLADRRGGTSVVLISHRLSTVRAADRIVVLDGGTVTESGTHDELIALEGTYATLFAIQAERFHRDEAPATQETRAAEKARVAQVARVAGNAALAGDAA